MDNNQNNNQSQSNQNQLDRAAHDRLVFNRFIGFIIACLIMGSPFIACSYACQHFKTENANAEYKRHQQRMEFYRSLSKAHPDYKCDNPIDEVETHTTFMSVCCYEYSGRTWGPVACMDSNGVITNYSY